MYDVILSGKITGAADYRVKFALAQVYSRGRWPGASVWNPATLPPDRSYKWYMRRCLAAILDGTHERSRLVRLKGWHRSLGAVAEWAVARCLGVEVVDQWW